MAQKWKAGDKVDANGGYPGVVVRYYSEGMVEVRLESGVVCIPECDISVRGGQQR